MEATGLAVGAVGLASLFTTCVECFDYYEAAKASDEDVQLAVVELDVAKAQFVQWGESVGLQLDNPDATVFPEGSEHIIRQVLAQIQRLLAKGGESLEKYGIQEDSTVRPTNIKRLSSFGINRLRARLKGWHPRRSVRWAIHDAKNFKELLTRLRGLISSLKDIWPEDIPAQDKAIAEDMAQLIDEVESLELYEKSCRDLYPALSEAASVALDASEQGSYRAGSYAPSAATIGLGRYRELYRVGRDALLYRPTSFNEKVHGFELSNYVKFFFVLTEQCHDGSSTSDCKPPIRPSNCRNFDYGYYHPLGSRVKAHVQVSECFPYVEWNIHVEHLRSIKAKDEIYLDDFSLEDVTLAAKVLVYCAPCPCQVVTASVLARNGKTHHLTFSIRIDPRLNSRCCASVSKIDTSVSFVEWLKSIEESNGGVSSHGLYRTIDRIWLEQQIEEYKDRPHLLDPSPENYVNDVARDASEEDERNSRPVAAIVILAESDYGIPLITSPPFPPLERGKVLRETEMYMIHQKGQQSIGFKRKYLGTYVSQLHRLNRDEPEDTNITSVDVPVSGADFSTTSGAEDLASASKLNGEEITKKRKQ